MPAADITVLPDLNDTSYHITEEMRDEYQQNGHILLKNLIDKQDLEPYRQAIIDATIRLSDAKTPWEAFLQYLNLWPHDQKVAKFVLAKRFARIAADLMGVENVRIYHDAALFKEPGGAATPWHQDQYYFPIDTPNVITMWMPMVDISTEMGMLTFASESQVIDATHEGGRLMKITPDDFEKVVAQLVHDRGFPISQAKTMKAGDATWHSGWTMHSAPRNSSKGVREIMTVIYVADGARVTKPINPNQQIDVESWLDNKKPGELVDSKLNPLVL